MADTGRETTLRKDRTVKKLATSLTAAALLLGAGSASAQVVITSHGIFADCDAAWEYRDGPLLDMLDATFTNYDADVEQRIQDTIALFEQHRAAAEAAYTAADAEQKRRIALTVGKWLFLEAVSNLSMNSLPKDVKEAYSEGQLKAFQQVVESSNSLKVEVAESIVTGTPPDTILSDQAAELMLGILGKYFGPVGQFLTGAAKTSVDSAVHYWETQPIKDVAEQNAEIFATAAKNMHAKSKYEKIVGINAVKNEIDAACGQ